MQNRYIMTAFGKDRPGIVADVTEILYAQGCNLEDTRMSLLADEFTLNLLFSSQRPDLEQTLHQQCLALENDKGVSSFIRPLPERQASISIGLSQCTLHVEGIDQAGIVYKVSRFLAARKLNIIDLRSTVKPTPESGSNIYLMDIKIQLPAERSAQQVEQELSTVADELNVEIHVSH
jgi:glycine cleavage system transcriptional repressor